MAISTYLTHGGKILLARMLASDKLIYTRAVTSASVADDPAALTSLPFPKQTADFIGAEHDGEYAKITARFSCSELDESYQLKTLGIYAKIEGDTDDVLYKVVDYNSDGEAVALPARQDIDFRFVFIDAVDHGAISISVSPESAAPAEHVPNALRHIFTQTNDTSPAIVDSGLLSRFNDGQRIVFVPRCALTGNQAQISCAGSEFDIKTVDLAGNTVSCVLIPGKTYVLTYRASDQSFVYIKHNEIEYVEGVGHYWDGTGWKTVVEAGRIITSAASSAPPGTLPCDGRTLSASSYPELYAALGHAFGGTTNTSFKIPDLRGRCPIGASSNHELGSKGGAETVTLTVSNLPAHTHETKGKSKSTSHGHEVTIQSKTTSHRHPIPDLYHPDGNIIAAGGDRQYAYTSSEYTQGAVTKLTSVTHDHNGTVSTNSHYHEIDLTTSSAGSGAAVNNMQPYLAVNYYIYTGRPLI